MSPLNASNNSPCPICFNEEDDDNSSFIALSCNCKACVDCLSQWITLKISENHYTVDSKISCIMMNCKKDLCIEGIYQRMPLSTQQKMDEALLQVYFSKEKDIRKCPNSNCTYAGIINTKSSCTSPLQCDLCGTQWRDKQHYTTFENLQDWFRNRSKPQAEDLSETWIKQRSKKCPSCKVNIEKNGGCDHMTCKKCGHQFCWICKWRFPRHNPMVHLYRQYLPFFIAALVILSLIIYAIYYFGIIAIFKFFVGNFFWIIYKVIYFFFYSIFYVIWNFGLTIINCIITNGLVIATLITIFGRRMPFAMRAKGILGISAFIGFSVCVNYFEILLGILKTELYILFAAGLCFFAVIGCVALKSRIRRNARRRLE